jgi:hypothetical protein
MKLLCINCGRPEELHCTGFEVRKMPDGCQCDEGSWGNDVTPICAEFIPGGLAGNQSYCKTCEHDMACHASQFAASETDK